MSAVDPSTTRRMELMAQLGEVLRQVNETGDARLVASLTVQAEVQALRESLDERHGSDLEARHLLGWLRWYQEAALPEPNWESAANDALEEFSPLAIMIGAMPFPSPLLPALADIAAPQLAAMIEQAGAVADPSDLHELLHELTESWKHLVEVTPMHHPDRPHRLSALCGALLTRHQRSGHITDLDGAVAAGRDAVRQGQDEPDVGIYLSNLAVALKAKFEYTRSEPVLHEAVEIARRAVSVAPRNELVNALTNLCAVLLTRFDHTHSQQDLTDAQDEAQRALAISSPDHRYRSSMLHNLGRVYFGKFGLSGLPTDLNMAVHAARDAIRLRNEDTDHAMLLSSLAEYLEARFFLTRASEDLDDAIQTLRSLTHIESGLTSARSLLRLALALQTRVALTSDSTSIDEFISVARHAAETEPTNSTCLVLLSAALLSRNDSAAVQEAVAVGRQAVAAAPSEPNEARSFALSQLDKSLEAATRTEGPSSDLDDEIVSVRQARVALTDPTEASYSQMLTRLGIALVKRFDNDGDPLGLDDAVDIFRKALECAPSAEERQYCLSDLCFVLQRRFEARRTAHDLDEVVRYARTAPELDLHVLPTGLLLNFAHIFDALARSARAVDLLDVAIEYVRKATSGDDPLQRTPPSRTHIVLRADDIWSDPNRVHSIEVLDVLRLLAAYLIRRFQWTEARGDINEAIQVRQQIAEEDPSSAVHQAGLAFALKARFNVTRSPGDLDRSLVAIHQAVYLEPDNILCNYSLSNTLKLRFDVHGDLNDLTRAVEFARRAHRLAPDGNPLRAGALANLCDVLRAQYESQEFTTDIDEAVDLGRQAVRSAGTDSSRFEFMLILVAALETRIERRGSRSRTDRSEALTLLKEYVNATTPPSLRLNAAKRGAALALKVDNPGGDEFALVAHFLEVAIRLLPTITGLRMHADQRRAAVESVAGVVGDAVAFALSDPTRARQTRAPHALSLLEMGRAVLLNQLLEVRGDLDSLRRVHPDLAERLTSLHELLDVDTTLDPDLAGADFEMSRVAAAAELEATLREVREIDGFSTFAGPPTKDDLASASAAGPVVVLNVAFRCDALIVSGESVFEVPLPAVDASEIVEQVNTFHIALRDAHDLAADRPAAQETLSQVLRWVWDNITGPVLDALGEEGSPGENGELPRIWWAPGGYLSLLPLHASGHHQSPSEGNTVMDRVVSSYVPTIRSLIHARSRRNGSITARGPLIVGMPKTPGLTDLANVSAEIELVNRIATNAFVLTNPERSQVLAELPGREVVHFACHGTYDPDHPWASRLMLNDHVANPLTAGSLASADLAGAQLAYLSACHTAVNTAERLLDEAMHLAGGIQAAGFPQVVATLWELDDDVAVEIAEYFYSSLKKADSEELDLSNAARSLHRATRVQRDNYPNTPSLWAAHVHYGA